MCQALGPGLPHIISLGPQRKHMRQRLHFHLVEEETAAQMNWLTCSDSNPELSRSRARPLSLSHITCNSRIQGRILKLEGHQVQDPGVQENQRFGGKNPCGWDEMDLFPYTFEQTGGFLLCHYPPVNLSGVRLCIPLLICKQDSFLPPTCFTGGADEVYNVCKSLWAHQRQHCINTILLYTFP